MDDPLFEKDFDRGRGYGGLWYGKKAIPSTNERPLKTGRDETCDSSIGDEDTGHELEWLRGALRSRILYARRIRTREILVQDPS